MVLEFIIIHSSGFMSVVIYGNSPKVQKIKVVLGLGLFYFLFVGGFAFSFKSWWPVIAFGGLMFNRMMSILTGQAEAGKEYEFVKNMWGMHIFCYLISVFAVIFIPLPALGVSQNDLSHLNISGDFVDHPEKMMAWGFLYFSLIGWFELKAPQWMKNKVTS